MLVRDIYRGAFSAILWPILGDIIKRLLELFQQFRREFSNNRKVKFTISHFNKRCLVSFLNYLLLPFRNRNDRDIFSYIQI